jgi:hypothetical protein
MSAMTPPKQDRRVGQTYSVGMNVRLSPVQAAYLRRLAEWNDVGVSEALRLVLDESLDRWQAKDPDGGSLRDRLEQDVVDELQQDLFVRRELARQGVQVDHP